MSDILITAGDPFPIIKRAVGKAAAMVRPTFGPASNKVIIKKATHSIVVDDGVQILRDLEFSDPNEHAVLQVVKEAAIKTNDRAGDGTTGATIMLDAMIIGVSELRQRDGHKIERELKKGLKEATDQLRAQAKPVKTLEDLRKVARISFDDQEVSGLIAETWHKVGVDGVVTVDTSPTMKTSAELTEGVNIEHGYLSPYMVNNPERMEALLDKPYVLITDYRITEGEDLLPLMNLIAGSGKYKRLLIVAENVEQSALATLVINQPHVMNPQTKQPGVLQSVAVVGPTGDDRLSKLEDIAILTGARVFSMSKGDRIQEAKLEDLGTCDKVIAKSDSTVIMGPKGKASVIRKAVADLHAAKLTAATEKEKTAIEKRIAFFSNKIAVIKVGSPTQNEQKALKYKVEDAVNAVKAAYKGGVVCGSGLSLARIETSSALLNEALKAPHKQLLVNMSAEMPRALKDGEAMNVVTGEIGKWMDVGVADPVDVLVAGIESAVSIASLLVTTSGMIVERPQKLRHE